MQVDVMFCCWHLKKRGHLDVHRLYMYMEVTNVSVYKFHRLSKERGYLTNEDGSISLLQITFE